MPEGAHRPSLTRLGLQILFPQILRNAVITKINLKVNLLFLTLQVHSELWLQSKV